MRLIFAILVLVLLVGCQFTASAAMQGVYEIPVEWSLFASSPQDRTQSEALLRIFVNGRITSEKTILLSDREVRQTLTLPSGTHRVTAEIAGKYRAEMTIPAAPGIAVQLFLVRMPAAEMNGLVLEPDYVALLYEIQDRSPAQTSDEVHPAAVPLPPTVPVHVQFRGTYERSIPVRIHLDGRIVFDGFAPAGYMNTSSYLLCVAPGEHNVRIQVPGAVEKTYTFHAVRELWIEASYMSGTTPKMDMFIASYRLEPY